LDFNYWRQGSTSACNIPNRRPRHVNRRPHIAPHQREHHPPYHHHRPSLLLGHRRGTIRRGMGNRSTRRRDTRHRRSHRNSNTQASKYRCTRRNFEAIEAKKNHLAGLLALTIISRMHACLFFTSTDSFFPLSFPLISSFCLFSFSFSLLIFFAHVLSGKTAKLLVHTVVAPVLIFCRDKGRRVRRLLLVALLSDYEGCILTPLVTGVCLESNLTNSTAHTSRDGLFSHRIHINCVYTILSAYNPARTSRMTLKDWVTLTCPIRFCNSVLYYVSRTVTARPFPQLSSLPRALWHLQLAPFYDLHGLFDFYMLRSPFLDSSSPPRTSYSLPVLV